MPDPRTNKLTIAEYKEAQLKLCELTELAVSGLAAVQQAGDLAAAKTWIALLKEAQGIALGLYGRDAVDPGQLKEWLNDDDFISKTTSTTKLGIDARVEGLDAKTRKEQELFLKEQGGEMAPFADLAVAHAAFFILTGESLFQEQWVRACGGALTFFGRGLGVRYYHDDFSNSDVSASRSLPSTS